MVGRWGAEGEQEMLQMIKEREGEDKGVGPDQEEGPWREAVEGLWAEEDMEAKNLGVFHSQ